MSIKFFKSLAVMSCVAVLAGCGAGGGAALLAGVGSGGTGLVAGTITGFGSVIIDGTHYPDTTASYDVTGDASTAQAISRTQVGIGARAEVDTDASGNATAVHIIPEVIGVVSAISAPTNSFTVAGTRVVVNASDPTLPITVYDGYTQFSDIQVNDRIEVYGLPKTDAVGPYVAATRIELKPGVCTGGCPVRVSGTVSNAQAGSFSLGGLTVNYGAATTITPAGQSLANGERVSVFSKSPLSGTTMNADAIAIRKLSSLVSGVGTLRLSGEIDNYVSNSSFSVHGVSVNAATATLSPTSLNLANDVEVIVAGSFDPATNVLTATSVSQYNSDTIQAELHGTISNFVSAANFQVRGVLVDAGSAIFTPAGKSSADLQNNVYVEIHGKVSNNIVIASTVDIQSVQSASEGSVGDLQGVVSNFSAVTNTFTLTLDNENGSQIQAVLGAKPFYVGGTSAALQNGAYVSLNAALVGSQWQVSTVTFMLAPTPSGEGGGVQNMGREMEGTINSLSGSTFSLNGITVDFSNAAISGGQPANGLQVQVYGTMNGMGSAAILTASKLEIDN
ncbi:hypothetical protein GALL_213500 [mine drainage metagenome]|uniref:DUF5666 domain-containing protein n=1 Tax=mine drainage metagenome TaxID=410659 RepID=A0A1J5RXG7_9ZZZZ